MVMAAIGVGAIIATAITIVKIHDVQTAREFEKAKDVAVAGIQERIARNRRIREQPQPAELDRWQVEFLDSMVEYMRKKEEEQKQLRLRHKSADGLMVYIASPLRGDIENNLRRASAYCRAAMEAGAVPIAPHLYFVSFLDDTKPSERRTGMEMGLHMLRRCDELWVFGAPSEGMRAEIKLAKSLKKPIFYIPEETARQITKENSGEGGQP